MKNRFYRGAEYAFAGVRDFYKYKFLWKYAAVPLAVLFILYGSIFIYSYNCILPWIKRAMTSFPDWFFFSIGGVSTEHFFIFMAWFYIAVFTAFVSNVVFEAVGSFFFPAMVRSYQQQVMKLEVEKLPKTEIFRNALDMLMLNCVIAVLFSALSLLSLVFPFGGILIFFVLAGYQYSMLFMSEACFNSHSRLSDIKYLFMKKKSLLYGFGFWTFSVIQLPLLSIFFYPGFVLGGTVMFCRETNEYQNKSYRFLQSR